MSLRMAMDAFERTVEEARERWGVPGIAVGVEREGERRTVAFGMTSLETLQPVTPDTLFQIGSISKVFATTVLMTLVDEGRVELDAPVSRYLPQLELSRPGLADQITVRHLVTHQSGIWGDYFDDYGWGDDALRRAVSGIRDLPQTYEPGELWSYCNAGFEIAGLVVEEVTGESYETVASDRLIKPLGLTRTFFFPHEVFAYPHAVGHVEQVPESGDFSVARDYWLSRALSPVGSLLSTAGDLLTFARFHMGDGTWNGRRILSSESIEAMRTKQCAADQPGRWWGLGWSVSEAGGQRVISHTGGTNGFTALLVVIPERAFALAVLTNSSSGRAAYRDVEHYALAHELDIPSQEPDFVELGDEELAQVAGTYRSPRSQLVVTAEGGGISLSQRSLALSTEEPVSHPPVHFKPVGPRDFVAHEGREAGSHLDFIPGKDGTIRFLRAGGRLHNRVEG